jgi:hypothetical protein
LRTYVDAGVAARRDDVEKELWRCLSDREIIRNPKYRALTVFLNDVASIIDEQIALLALVAILGLMMESCVVRQSLRIDVVTF